MANIKRREALRGAEEETFDLLAQVLTSDQWAKLLRIPLGHAVTKGNRGIAQKLMGAGANIGDALHKAARGGHEEIANDLLDHGASVASKDTSFHAKTPLHAAASEGQTDMVQLLLLKGADKDALDKFGYTPLYMAADFRNEAAALALLEAGADIRIRCGPIKTSVVQVAARHGHVGILRAAIERGVDVDAAEMYQRTILHTGALFNKVKTIDLLVEAGVDIEARDEDGWTPLQVAARQVSLDAVLALLKHGANVDVEDNYQTTPLHSAAAVAGTEGAADVVDSLLRSGADETILNVDGQTAADVVEEVLNGESYQPAENVDRVRQLLANAPADRAWRRRGYLVLCRAHPNRLHQVHESSTTHAGVAPRPRTSDTLGRTEARSCTGTAGGSTVDGRTDGDMAVVVARVLRLQEEDVFRTIVGYL